jgi:hypothetical protein
VIYESQLIWIKLNSTTKVLLDDPHGGAGIRDRLLCILDHLLSVSEGGNNSGELWVRMEMKHQSLNHGLQRSSDVRRYFSSVGTKRAFDLYLQVEKSPYVCRLWFYVRQKKPFSGAFLCFTVQCRSVMNTPFTFLVGARRDVQVSLASVFLSGRSIPNPVVGYFVTVSQIFVQYTILCQYTLVFENCAGHCSWVV